MNVHYAEDLKRYSYELPEIEKHTLTWAFRKPEQRSHQVRIQALMNLLMPSIHDRYEWNEEKLDAWKLRQLQTLVDWAFETCPFYQDLYRRAGYETGAIRSYSDFANLPTTTRDDLVRGFPNQVVSREFDKDNCRWFFSSGSSGTPVQLVTPQERTEWDTLHRLRMFERMAGKRFPRDRWIYNVNHAHWWHTSFNGELPVFSISQQCSVESVVEHLKKLRPVFISTITGFAQKLADQGVNLSEFGVTGLSTNSETSTPAWRKKISGILGVPVCDEYSSEEAGLMAHECEHGTYHLMEDDTHLETVREDTSGLGEIVATDLWNFAMPVIRYEQGDLGRISTERRRCGCGSIFRELKGVEGRRDEAFIREDGSRIAPGEMLEISESLLSMSGMHEYRVIQKSTREIEVIFTLVEDSVVGPLLDQFCHRMSERFGYPITVRYEQMKTLPLLKRHKRKVFIQAISNI